MIRTGLIFFLALAIVLPSASAELPALDAEKLTLEQCLQRSLRNNLSIKSQEVEWEIAEWNIHREWAGFEPLLGASARREAEKRENTVEQTRSQLSNLFEEENEIYDIGLEGLFVSGARYRLGYNVSDLANNLTNRTYQTEFESQYASFLGASLTQPLLKGAWLSANMAGVRLATAQRDKATHTLRRQVMQIVAQTEVAYWDLVLAQEEYEARTESVRVAERILEDNRERVRSGKMSELEVLQAQAGVADRKTRQNDARQELIEATHRLRTLFSETVTEEQPALLAVEKPELEDFTFDFTQMMYLATQLQPDYLVRESELDEENVRLAYAKNQRWPQIDLVGSYGYNGLGATTSDSWDKLESGEFPAWSIGLELKIGLGTDQRARSEHRAARLRQEQALMHLKHTEIEIGNSVKSSLRNLDNVGDSIDQYRTVVDFNRQLLEVELERLDAGKSNSRRVLEAEDELAMAEVAYRREMNSHQRAVINLELSSGILLATRNLEIIPYEQGGTPREPSLGFHGGVDAPDTVDELNLPVPRGDVEAAPRGRDAPVRRPSPEQPRVEEKPPTVGERPVRETSPPDDDLNSPVRR